MIHSLHTYTNGYIHIYVIGHIGQGALVHNYKSNDTKYEKTSKNSNIKQIWQYLKNYYNKQQLILRSNNSFLTDPKKVQYTMNNREQYTLRETISHKQCIFTRIRERHPTSRYILAGHSMGSYVITTILQAIEDIINIYYIKNKKEIKEIVNMDDVEKEYMIKNIYIPSKDITLPNEVIRIRYTKDELLQWKNIVDPQNILNTTTTTTTDSTNYKIKNTNEIYTSFIVQIQFLLPTQLRIADTKNGWNLVCMLRLCRLGILQKLCYIVDIIPNFIVRAILSYIFNINTQNNTISSSCLQFNGESIANACHLYKCEAQSIRCLDIDLLKKYASRCIFYFNENDGWTPSYQIQYIKKLYSTYWSDCIQDTCYDITSENTIKSLSDEQQNTIYFNVLNTFIIDNEKYLPFGHIAISNDTVSDHTFCLKEDGSKNIAYFCYRQMKYAAYDNY